MARSPDLGRRTFLGAIAAASLPGWSQPRRSPAEHPRIACLANGDERVLANLRERVVSGLAAAGVSGSEIRFFSSSNDYADMARSAQAAVAWPPDAILVPGPALALAARDATRSIPVVFFAVPDPDVLGLVATIARPGGNVTGSAVNGGPITLKRLELVRELLPHARKVTLMFRRPPNAGLVDRLRRLLPEAAQRLNLKLEDAEVGPGGRGFTATLATLAKRPPDAILPFGPVAWEPDAPNPDYVGLFVEFERRHRVPVMHEDHLAVTSGATITMFDGGSQLQAAIEILARVLKGMPPAQMAVEYPVRYRLELNTGAASAIGVAISPALRIRADRIVE